MVLVTLKSVQEAIKTLEDREERVSQRNIRRLLGGGSPNLINRYFREIQEADAGSGILTEVPEWLQALLIDEINTLTRAATEKLTADLDAARQETSDAVADLEKAQKEIEELKKAMEVRETEHRKAIRALEKTIEQLTDEKEEAEKEALENRDNLRAVSDALKKAKSEAATQRDTALRLYEKNQYLEMALEEIRKEKAQETRALQKQMSELNDVLGKLLSDKNEN
jgi:chromosome segregation ATPase